MAHSLSAKKRVRQNAKRRAVNRARKSQVRTQTRHVESALKSGDVAAAEQEFTKAVKKLDKAASASTMHKNTAARKKSQLARHLNTLKAKEVGT